MSVHLDTGLLTSLPGRYAKSLFELAQVHNTVDLYFSALKTLHETIQGSPLLQSTLGNPAISWEQEANAFVEISKALKLPKMIQQFVFVATRAGRLDYLDKIIDNYHRLIATLRGEQDIEVVSAYPLIPLQEKKLKNALEQAYSDTLTISFSVDPTLLGGLLIRVGGWVVDATLSARLGQFVGMMKGQPS